MRIVTYNLLLAKIAYLLYKPQVTISMSLNVSGGPILGK